MTTGDGRPPAFWRTHLRSGLVISFVIPVVISIRVLLRPETPHPTGILAISATVLVLTPLLLLVPLDRLVDRGRARHLFYAWDVIGLLAVSAIVLLDGGAASPYRTFLFVVIAHAALAFPPSGTLAMGMTGVLAYVTVGLVGPANDLADTAVVTAALALVTAVGAIASNNYLALNRQIGAVADRATVLAERDGLTGCLNHRTFHARVEAATRGACPGTPISVLVLDVDHFKQINDVHGHPAGDEVLHALGQALRSSCRGTDAAGRLGGDEFALLLVGADAQAAAAAGERLHARIRAGLLPYGATVTIGTATAQTGTSAKVLVADADAELYATRRRERPAATEEARPPARS